MSSAYFTCHQHTTPCQHIRGHYGSTARSQEEGLRLAVKQYIPSSGTGQVDGGVTFIMCHAAGVCKELYEVFFDELYQASIRQTSEFCIRSIWAVDVSTHGQSASLNEGKLGIDCK